MLRAFKEQQRHYREFVEGMKVYPCLWSPAKFSLPQQLKQHLAVANRASFFAMQKIHVPLNGDESAIKKYASEVEALKRKVGLRFDDKA